MRMGLALAVSNGSGGVWLYGLGIALLVGLGLALLIRRMRGKPGRHSDTTAEGAWRPPASGPGPGSPWPTSGENGRAPAGPSAAPAQPGAAAPVPAQPSPGLGAPAGSKWGQPFDPPPPPPRPAPPGSSAPGSTGRAQPSAPPPLLGGAGSAGASGLPGQPVDPVPGFEPLPAWNLDPEPSGEIARSRAPEPPPTPGSPPAPPQATPAPPPAPPPGAPVQPYEPAAAPAYEPAPAGQTYDPSTGFDAPTPLATPIYEPAASPWRAYEPGSGGAGAGTSQGVTGGDQTPTWESAGTRVWVTPVEPQRQATNGWLDEELEFAPEAVSSYEDSEPAMEKAASGKPEEGAGLGAPPILEAPPGEKLAFVAAYPPAVVAGEWSPMLVVLHAASAQVAVDALLDRRAAEFGGEPARSSTSSAAPVRRGTTLTLIPSVPGVEFNPPRLDVAWYEDVQEANFRMRATDSAGRGLYGAVEVFVGPLLVAVIPIGMRLTEASTAVTLPTQTQRAAVLDRIFVSYSRRDTPVVQACATVYRALGVQVLMDTVDLRSGQDWRESLHAMISGADLFQLYWSSASAASSEVEHEWRYARTLTNKGPSFIRPLYWESPMPEPPAELSSVHFSRMDVPQIAG